MTLTDLLPVQRTALGRMVFHNELSLMVALALLVSIVIHAPVLFPLRVVLGVMLAVFFPGYAILAAMFPYKDSLDWLERIGLSVGVSLAIIPIIAYALHFTPWGIKLYPVLVSLTLVILLASIVGMARRERMPREERFFSGIPLVTPEPGRWPLRPPAYLALAAVAVAGAGLIVYTLGKMGDGDSLTEFYVLGPSGQARQYPRELQVGQPASFDIGIDNNENKDREFEVTVRIGAEELARVPGIRLERGSSRRLQVEVTPRAPEDNAKVEFLLFTSGQPEPYRSLHLWTNVKRAESR